MVGVVVCSSNSKAVALIRIGAHNAFKLEFEFGLEYGCVF